VYDARGSFIEPHTDREVAIGTLEVRNYLQRRVAKKTELGGLREEPPFPTYGPENRYRAILFIEKEGFHPLLRAAQIAERFDIAIMSTKGMSTTAARQRGRCGWDFIRRRRIWRKPRRSTRQPSCSGSSSTVSR